MGGSTAGLQGAFLRGGVSFGAATAVQRALGFMASLLAARIGGPGMFGAYTIGLSTAATAATCLGLGIGSTSCRFIAEVPRGVPGYRETLARLTGIALACGAAAFLVLFFGSGPIAELVFDDRSYAGLVRAAAVSVLAIILFETLLHIGLGLLDFRIVFMLSGLTGIGMVAALSIGASFGAPEMLLGQGVATLLAVVATVVLLRRRIAPPVDPNAELVAAPSRTEILKLGVTKLFSSLSLGLASWWIAVLVIHADASLREIGFYGVGNQFRSIVTMVPTQLSALVLPLMARLGPVRDDQDRLVSSSTLAVSGTAMAIGGITLLALPAILALYGGEYADAGVTSALLAATAVVHMSGAPAISSLIVVDVRAFAWINLASSVVLVVLAAFLVPLYGSAGAGAAWLAMQALTQLVACAVLLMRGRLAPGLAGIWLCSTGAIVLSAACATWRSNGISLADPALGAQVLILAGAAILFFRLAQRLGHLPADSKEALTTLKALPGALVAALQQGNA